MKISMVLDPGLYCNLLQTQNETGTRGQISHKLKYNILHIFQILNHLTF